MIVYLALLASAKAHSGALVDRSACYSGRHRSSKNLARMRVMRRTLVIGVTPHLVSLGACTRLGSERPYKMIGSSLDAILTAYCADLSHAVRKSVSSR